MASRALHLFALYFVMIGLTINNIRGQNLDPLCATKMAAGADGGNCIKVIGPLMYADDAQTNCAAAESGAILYRPKSTDQLAIDWTSAVIAYVAANPEDQTCLGPLWTAWNDKATDAGADGSSPNWVLPDGTSIDTTDLKDFWTIGFPVADIGPLEIDCVAAIAIDKTLANTTKHEGGLINLPCSSVSTFNASVIPSLPGGLTLPPDIPSLPSLNQSQWCALCTFDRPGLTDLGVPESSVSSLPEELRSASSLQKSTSIQ